MAVQNIDDLVRALRAEHPKGTGWVIEEVLEETVDGFRRIPSSIEFHEVTTGPLGNKQSVRRMLKRPDKPHRSGNFVCGDSRAAVDAGFVCGLCGGDVCNQPGCRIQCDPRVGCGRLIHPSCSVVRERPLNHEVVTICREPEHVRHADAVLHQDYLLAVQEANPAASPVRTSLLEARFRCGSCGLWHVDVCPAMQGLERLTELSAQFHEGDKP